MSTFIYYFMSLNLGVFLGSSVGINPKHRKTVIDFADWIGKKDINVVFGGSELGLMKDMIERLVLHKNKIKGIINYELSKQNKPKLFSDLIVTANLSERMEKFIYYSDFFVVLPGGLGTTYEVFDILIKKLSNETTKQLFLINDNNFWTPLRDFFQYLQKEGFVDRKHIEKNIHFCKLESFKKKIEKENYA